MAHACRAPYSAKQDGLREAALLFRRGSGALTGRWWFCWGALYSDYACRAPHSANRMACGRLRFCSAGVGSDDGALAVLLGRFAFGLRLLFDVNANRTACGGSLLFRGGQEH